MKLSLSPNRLPSLPSAVRPQWRESSNERNRAATKAVVKAHDHDYLQNRQHGFDFGAPHPAVVQKKVAATKVGRFRYRKRDTAATSYCASCDKDGLIDDDGQASASSTLSPGEWTRAQEVSPPTPTPPPELRQERGRRKNENRCEGQARSRSPSPEVEIWIQCPQQQDNFLDDSPLSYFDDDWSWDPVEAEELNSASTSKSAAADGETIAIDNVQKREEAVGESYRADAMPLLALDSVISSQMVNQIRDAVGASFK